MLELGVWGTKENSGAMDQKWKKSGGGGGGVSFFNGTTALREIDATTYYGRGIYNMYQAPQHFGVDFMVLTCFWRGEGWFFVILNWCCFNLLYHN